MQGTNTRVKMNFPEWRGAVSQPFNFLLGWIRDNMNPTVYDDKPGAEYLAEECLRDAKEAGVDEAELIKSARGDLTKFMLSELNIAVKKRHVG
jgi:hypothetical protein